MIFMINGSLLKVDGFPPQGDHRYINGVDHRIPYLDPDNLCNNVNV